MCFQKTLTLSNKGFQLANSGRLEIQVLQNQAFASTVFKRLDATYSDGGIGSGTRMASQGIHGEDRARQRMLYRKKQPT